MLEQAVVFFAMLAVASAYLEQDKLAPIPEKFNGQTGCYIQELDVLLPFDKSCPSKERCLQYRCNPYFVTIAGCGVVVSTPPCKVLKDTHKQYPDCCPRIECPNHF